MAHQAIETTIRPRPFCYSSIMKYSTILFDVDGTVCDPGISMIESARYALSKLGIDEKDDNKLHQLIGPPLEHAFETYYGFNEAEIKQAVIYFRENMQKEGVHLYEAYAGIAELLESLQEAGATLAIVTSKIENIAIDTLKKTNLIKYFKVISAQQPNVVVHKEAILSKALKDLNITDKSSVVMIGDRRHDVEAANLKNVASIGVLWGYGSLEELESQGASYIVKDAAQLSQLLFRPI